MIQQVTNKHDFDALTQFLNESFATVALEFGLTKENCPTNNAFITREALKSQLIENREFYTCIMNGQTVGFIAIEKSLNTPDIFYIEKLAVIPAYRHQGIGRQLMDFATHRIVKLGGKSISIGLINSNSILKNWYIKQGYVVRSVKAFDHLPFEVCFMEKQILKT